MFKGFLFIHNLRVSKETISFSWVWFIQFQEKLCFLILLVSKETKLREDSLISIERC